jgi:hypothetical protein
MFDKLIENLPKIMRAMTLGRVMATAFLAVVFVLCYILWDGRQLIVDKVMVSGITKRSGASIVAMEETRAEVIRAVERSPLIIGVQLVNVNFSANTRSTAFFFSERKGLQDRVNASLDALVSPSPALIKNDLENNMRLINLMAAEFICYETKVTLLARIVPDLALSAPYMCSISIPPYEGNFSGYLNLLLERAPGADEVTELRSIARLLAHSIYDRELR